MQSNIFNDNKIEKLVLLSGITGTNLRVFLDLARNMAKSSEYEGLNIRNTGFYKFEDELLAIKRINIETIVSFLLESRPVATAEFRKTAQLILNDIQNKGYKKAFIAIHLSYLSKGILIPNPVLNYLIKSAHEVTIIYYIEDYYHGLKRILKYLNEYKERFPEHSFVIDPIIYLEWRGLEHNIISLLATLHDNIETLIIGVKHPTETHKRLLHYASLSRHNGRKKYYHVYFSHPITFFRNLYTEGKIARLDKCDIIEHMEEVKMFLRDNLYNLILYEPTTIDELIYELPSNVNVGTICDKDRTLSYFEKQPFLSLIITRRNRWPIPHDAPHIRDYGEDINLFEKEYQELFSLLWDQLKSDFCNTILEGNRHAYIYSKLNDLIETQIKMRDYEYITQASALFVYRPILIDLSELLIDTEGDKKLIKGKLTYYMVESKGVEAEIRRALAFAKPVYVLYDIIYLNKQNSNERVLEFIKEKGVPCTDFPREFIQNYDDNEIIRQITHKCIDKGTRIHGKSPFAPESGIVVLVLDQEWKETLNELIEHLNTIVP